MTRGRVAVVVLVGATLIAVVGLLARPLLPHPGPGRAGEPWRPRGRPVVAPPAVFDLARRAATASICPNVDAACHVLAIDRVQGYCPSAQRCVVTLLATRTASRLPIPVALTVTVIRDIRGWHVLEVTS